MMRRELRDEGCADHEVVGGELKRPRRHRICIGQGNRGYNMGRVWISTWLRSIVVGECVEGDHHHRDVAMSEEFCDDVASTINI